MENLIKEFWKQTADLIEKYRKEGDERAAQGIVDCRILINKLSQTRLERALATNSIESTEQQCNIADVSGSLLSEIRDEMDSDMEDSGMAQGEIESCLNHWSNKYIIQRKEWFSNDR